MELLEDLVVAGVNKALEQAAALAKDEMGRAAGSMLPPGFDMSQFGF
ncbi:MAG TPA: YbaB/EbfC family nucleoid-associated protein [Rhodothermales bacterium]|nr:YbaB/EbfC family nucleoid-associated protein [Rhodothermales bacterium]